MSTTPGVRFAKWIGLITLLALVLRLTVVLVAADLPIGLDDMFQYDMLARSIVSGNGYRWYAEEDLELIRRYIDMEPPPGYDPRGIRTSFRPPLYPAFLAAVYALFGTGTRRFLAARLVQAVLGAALAPLTALLARRLGFEKRTALGSATIVALYPLLVIYPLALATENLYILLLLLSLWAVLRAGKEGRPRDAALAGALLGITALTRSVVTFFVPLAIAWIWFVAPSRRRGLTKGALLVGCFLLLTVPWSVRNTLLHGEFHFIESALGYDLYQGYHPQSSGTFNWRIGYELLTMLDDGERHRLGMEAFWSFVRSNPGRIPYLMFRKLGYFWGLDKRAFIYFYANDYFGRWPAGLLAGTLVGLCSPFVIVAAAGLAGLALARPRREIGLVALLMTYYVGIHTLILAEDRFHMPLVPLLAILAVAFFLERPWKRARPWQRGLALGLVVLLFANWGWEIARDWELLTAIFGPEGNRLWIGF
jgi:4-amino-4-deoxy-L-arabinose transferase-like glycosyltransferase